MHPIIRNGNQYHTHLIVTNFGWSVRAQNNWYVKNKTKYHFVTNSASFFRFWSERFIRDKNKKNSINTKQLRF